MLQIILVGIGGFIGSVARYGVSLAALSLHRGPFPSGTLIVNVLGCMGMGAMMTLFSDYQRLSENARLFIGVGILGGFTTFSTFGHETIGLLRTDHAALAFLYAAGNLALGLLAVLAGRTLVDVVSGWTP